MIVNIEQPIILAEAGTHRATGKARVAVEQRPSYKRGFRWDDGIQL